MPRLKAEDSSFNIDELEEAEYTETEYESYDGEQPPKGTILTGLVKKLWWSETAAGDDKIVVLFTADGNEGDLEEYDGLPVWEHLALIPSTKFRWKPFIDQFGITLQDIKKKIVVAEQDDRIGAPIEKVGTFVPGSDEAWCRVLTDRHRYNGEWQTDIGKWLDYEEPGEEEGEMDPDMAEDLEAETEVDEVDEEEEVEDEDEEEVPVTPPARGRRAAPAVSARGARKPAKAATAATPAATPARGRKPAPARTAAAKPAAPAKPARGRRAAAATAVQDEPPF